MDFWTSWQMKLDQRELYARPYAPEGSTPIGGVSTTHMVTQVREAHASKCAACCALRRFVYTAVIGDTHSEGTTGYLIQVEELVALVNFQLAQPTNRVFKRTMIFPKNEWHD
eukprot:SAG31_NODE_3914_length_3756_cov_1.638228_5_plen_112_part_00